MAGSWGIVSNGTISGSSSSASVTGDDQVGGLVGLFAGTRNGIVISDCYATGDVRAEGNNSQAGGLVGRTSWAIVLNCYATGDVTLMGDNGIAGGLVGSHEAMIRNGYARGNVEVRGNNGIAGGLVGHSNRAKIRTSYATGNVIVVGGDGTAGGLVGYNRGEREVATISACYATGQAIASENAGGLIGAAEGGWLRACYSTGSVFGENIGGLIGSGDGFVEYSYFDHEASNRPETDAYAKSSDELHSVGSYTGIYANWAFDIDCDHRSDDIWNFVGDDKYPKLKLDFNGDLSATAPEFGEQLLVFVAADGREMLSPVFSASSGATAVVVGTLRGINAENDNAAQLALEGMSDVFELASNGELSVQGGKEVNYVDAPYTVLVRLTEGTRSVVRSVSVQVAALNDNDSDGLIDVTTLEQLHAIHFDLNGDGQVDSGVTEADSIVYEMAFSLSRKGSIHCLASCVGYELMNNLDFEDIDATMMGDQPSIWSENCTDGNCLQSDGTLGDAATKVGWEPIGDNSTDSDATRFTAIFEGNDHTISTLYINRSGTSYVGLFGALGFGSNVRNLGIEGGSLSGAGNVGGLVGYNEGTIRACYATGNATGTGNDVGGLVGYNEGTISACYATGDVSGSSSVGGLVGWNGGGTISACYATGNASGEGEGNVGGLVGRNSDTISACYATGNATSTGEAVGGLVGRNGGTISACYATGDASGSSDVGGLMGLNSGTITNSYFDSTVNSALATTPIGGGTTTGSGITNVSGKTTTELQTPTAYGTAADIYANWNIDVDNGLDIGVDDGTMPGDAAADDPWDFGTGSEYPALRVDFNGDGIPTAFEFGGQGRAAPTAPAAPSALTATAANTAVTLSWTAPTSDGGAPIINYMVEYDTDMNFPSPTTATTAAAATSHTVSALTNGTPYYFRVAAVNSVGTGAYYPGAGDPAVSATPVAPLAISSISPTSGLVGATVMITGTGFSTTAADNTVTFLGAAGAADNAVVMTVSAATATELTVTVPSSAVTGQIQVEVNSVVAVSSDDFTVLMSVPPTDTDDDELINITTLTQLDAIRYDLNGDGVVSFTTAASLTGSPMFSNRAAVVTLMGAASAYAEAFTSGDFYTSADATTAATGAVAASTAYYYKLSSAATSPYTGYELMNNLDFEDANGDGTADDKSIWAEGASGAGVSGAVAEGWAPIGYHNSSTDRAYYTATFDGRGHTISNLYINRSGTRYVGLFGVLGTEGNVRNLGIEGGSVTGRNQVGGLVGWNDGTISACYATGNASGTDWVGGFVGVVVAQ